MGFETDTKVCVCACALPSQPHVSGAVTVLAQSLWPASKQPTGHGWYESLSHNSILLTTRHDYEDHNSSKHLVSLSSHCVLYSCSRSCQVNVLLLIGQISVLSKLDLLSPSLHCIVDWPFLHILLYLYCYDTGLYRLVNVFLNGHYVLLKPHKLCCVSQKKIPQVFT